MTILTKSLAWASAVGVIAGGILDFGNFTVRPFCTVFLPLGAVAFELFLISLMLEKEMAKFDFEEKVHKTPKRSESPFEGANNMAARKPEFISSSHH